MLKKESRAKRFIKEMETWEQRKISLIEEAINKAGSRYALQKATGINRTWLLDVITNRKSASYENMIKIAGWLDYWESL